MNKENMTKLSENPYLMKAFKCLCDWLCQIQKGGKFSGWAFQDQRAARGLLAGYEILNDKKYLEAATQWGETILNEQREDGGYRMGYGVWKDPPQEECYVADGGETSQGIMALYSYAGGEFKNKLRISADKYFKYRAGFRNEDGSYGVGWVKYDYINNNGETLKQKERVFRENRGASFVVSCSLGGAAAYSALTKNQEDVVSAVNDTLKCIEEFPPMIAGGVYIESLCWAHYYLQDEKTRDAIACCLNKKWIPCVTDKERLWWLEGAGRTVFGLDSLVYYYTNIKKSPDVLTAIQRATTALCEPMWRGVPKSDGTAFPMGHLVLYPTLTELTEQPDKINDSQWRYLCYGLLSLGDVILPNSSLRNL